MPPSLLSKSKYLNGLQCPKYLWTLFHQPDKIPEPDTATQFIFDQGHLVGELAKKRFPDGIDVPTADFGMNLKQTKELLQQHRTLFEGGILAGRIYSRADVLNPVNQDEWDIIEVKSSTGVKDVHLQDVAFQKLCAERMGLNISKCFLMYIDNQYIRDGDIDPIRLFAVQDITDEVRKLGFETQERVKSLLDVIQAGQCPDIFIGKQCNDPYACPLTKDCHSFLPEGNVLELYRGGKKSYDLLQRGVLSIKDIPESFSLSREQRIQRDCELSGEPHVDRDKIRQFLQTLQYPLYFLDFETINPGIPLFDGTRPYQTLPFQFSLHVVEEENAEPEHFSFLADGTDDLRPGLLSALKNGIGSKGSVVVFNQSFEKRVLQDLAEAFPDHGEWIDNVLKRIVDLLVPFRSFHYYHPLQRGSASMKRVLPALTGRSYEDMPIGHGEDAGVAFLAVTFGEVPEEMRAEVRRDLEAYCGLDTEGMIEIIEQLNML